MIQPTKYTRWKARFFTQTSTTGSRWFYGNFGFGIMVDSHPRFFCVTLALMLFEVGVLWHREVVPERCP